MKEDTFELGLGETLAFAFKLLDLGGQGATLAELVLDEDFAGLDPGVVVADNVLVLDQSGVSKHLIHGGALLVGIAANGISRHLRKQKIY